MKLRITTPESNGHFMTGSAANIFLDGVDVSRYTMAVELTVAADGPITAKVTFGITDVDVEVPAAIEPLLRVAREQYRREMAPVQ